jgi:hypothetical protein
MNKLKKGPDIDLSKLKVPDFILDLYWDLRERHLLPLVIVLLAAIVAIPIVLSQSSDPGESVESGTALATPSGTASAQSGELVARSAPGLRDYRRRLKAMQAKDPFKQQYAEAPASSEEAVGTSSSSSGSASPESSVSPEPTAPSSSPETSPASTETTTTHSRLQYFSYAIDVRVMPTGKQEDGGGAGKSSKPTVRHNLPELTMLPSRGTPAATFMGASKDGKKALFLISSDVQAVFGDGRCVVGTQTCQLLAVEPGLPLTFVYGPAGRTFKIELIQVHLIRSEKLNRAPLGKTKPKPTPQHPSGD